MIAAAAAALWLLLAAPLATLEEGLALKQAQKLPEAERVFAALVAENPQDEAALEQWATVLGWLGRFDDAVAAWQRALLLAPRGRAAVGLARVRYWRGELKLARFGLEDALARAPDDGDALLLAGDVCVAQGDLAAARAFYQRAQARDPGSPELAKRLLRTEPRPTRRVDVGGTYDHYSNLRQSEGSFFAQGSLEVAPDTVLSAGFDQLREFGFVDNRVNAGAYLRPLAPLFLHLRAAFTPSPAFLAKWEAVGDAELSLLSALTGLFSVRHLDFPHEGVTIFAPGVRVQAAPALSFAVQGGLVLSSVNSTTGYGLARAELQIADPARVYLGVSRGDEAQRPLPPATSTALTAGLLLDLPRAFGLRFDLAREDRKDTHLRYSAGSALTARF